MITCCLIIGFKAMLTTMVRKFTRYNVPVSITSDTQKIRNFIIYKM